MTTNNPTVIRNSDPGVHALVVNQARTSGAGSALHVHSDNASAPAAVVRGAGTIVEWRDANGATVASVSQAGALVASTVAAALTQTGDLTVNSGDVIINTAGRGLKIKEGGAAAKMGTLTLTGATPVVVSTTAVTATSRVFLTVQSVGGTPAGIMWVSARTPATSFSVTGIALDTSVVAWMIVEPA